MQLMNYSIQKGLKILIFGDYPIHNFACNFGTIPPQDMQSAIYYLQQT
jgi:hypothetical protein